MSKKLINPSQQPKVGGVGEQNVATTETNVPSTYFAGINRLKVSWLMLPINYVITNATSGKGSKGI
ncbi:MAG TPA: hypothetical protein VHG71_04940 [Verrucomicrobiae bacterium]|nr:hypothetical protein [Verrucomicrobiae bacterium]